ncbi:hypothetical protein [Planomicrobium sp. YIM 101495]|uniref:phage upper tail fiber protein n=1 Tax=Planomicrobium sp. YIM 101495 TaxID=2665160 RepID=UPI0012B9CEF2|nr:hypothetical protein [Planomicrobium sp. YIM 101495]MTD30152.1 hypothetical protein [Planomicrobium sp. YIM 101495]
MITKPVPHIIEVDLKQETQYYVPTVTQGDTATFFLVRVTDDGRSDQGLLDNFPTITMTSERPDRKSFYVLGERVEGTNGVMFHLGTDETLLTGSVRAAVQLYSVDGRNTSAQFRYEVDKDLTGEYVPSEREGSLIEQVLVRGPEIMAEAEAATLAAIKAREELTGAVNGALADLQADKKVALDEMSTAVTEANTARDGANAAATRADGAADDADSAAYLANQTKEETETVRQNTEAERLATSEEREATEMVRSSVEELIPQTEQARDGANEAGEFATEQGNIAQQQSADQLQQIGTVAVQMAYIQEEFLPDIASSVAETDQFVRQAMSDHNENGVGQIRLWTGTLAEYDAIPEKDDSILYWVRG